MVRIEIKKTVKGQMMLAMEAEHEELEEVLMCAARCFVGTARKLCGPISASPKNYRWKMERKSTKDDRVERARAEGLSADERAETRIVRVYSCYGADGTLLGKGTAAELKDKGLFGSEGTVHECYRKRGGVYKPGGVTRMEMELCQKRIRHPMKLPDQPAKVKRKPIGGVIDPSALAYDVHDLMIYNEKARKIGKPELTYGYWAEKGKPATP